MQIPPSHRPCFAILTTSHLKSPLTTTIHGIYYHQDNAIRDFQNLLNYKLQRNQD